MLKETIKAMTSDVNKAQGEIKALQAKLTAARNAATTTEQSRMVPGSTGKGVAASRAAMAANAESAYALQVAQLKEDLYSDLTGLIIRDVKRREGDCLYDCIQTGLNGSKSLFPFAQSSVCDFEFDRPSSPFQTFCRG